MDDILIDENTGPARVLYVETFPIGDPHGNSPPFDDAKRRELIGLIEKGTSCIVLEEEAGTKPNTIPSHFVLALKHSETGDVKYKARFVLGGQRDK